MRHLNEALLLGALSQHAATEAEEKLNSLLRGEIAERKLIEDELQQATLNAEKANLSKSEFLANVDKAFARL